MEYQSMYRYKRTRNAYNIEGEQMFDAVSCSTDVFMCCFNMMQLYSGSLCKYKPTENVDENIFVIRREILLYF